MVSGNEVALHVYLKKNCNKYKTLIRSGGSKQRQSEKTWMNFNMCLKIGGQSINKMKINKKKQILFFFHTHLQLCIDAHSPNHNFSVNMCMNLLKLQQSIRFYGIFFFFPCGKNDDKKNMHKKSWRFPFWYLHNYCS